MRILGLIPARGGSQGVPRKNLRLVAGRPLIAYTIEAAKGSRLLERFVTSTEDDEIAGVAAQWGSTVLRRPAALAADGTPMVSVVQHGLAALEPQTGRWDYVVVPGRDSTKHPTNWLFVSSIDPNETLTVTVDFLSESRASEIHLDIAVVKISTEPMPIGQHGNKTSLRDIRIPELSAKKGMKIWVRRQS